MQGREPVVEEEEDTSWAEVQVQDDPWGNPAVPADGT
jgi:hypothetical protein